MMTWSVRCAPFFGSRVHGLPGTGAEQENLLGTGVLDSLGVLEIVDFLETTFDIVVDEDDFDLEIFNPSPGSRLSLMRGASRRRENGADSDAGTIPGSC